MPDEVRVAVSDPAVSYRRGLGPVLASAGLTVDEPGDLEAWIAENGGPRALLHTVRSASDWETLGQAGRADPRLVTVALLVDATADRHAEALRCGASGAAPWDAPPERIVAVLAAALRGDTLVPTAVAAVMAATGPPLQDPAWITPEEVSWLQLLAGGATVQQLAEKAGYSERALYRVLHGLYGRMRVSNRTEAILQAARWGLIEIPPPGDRGDDVAP